MLFIVGQILYGLFLTAAVIATPVLIACLFFKRKRLLAGSVLLTTFLMIVCLGFGGAIGRKMRMAAWPSFTQRSQLLIDAIEAFERENDSPPASLNDLIPDYLNAVPSTGMNAYPNFEYQTGTETQKLYYNNPWVLSVFTPSGLINFDMMLYFPKQNYPTLDYGGRLERIGHWAYVHE